MFPSCLKLDDRVKQAIEQWFDSLKESKRFVPAEDFEEASPSSALTFKITAGGLGDTILVYVWNRTDERSEILNVGISDDDELYFVPAYDSGQGYQAY
jgi:hypothetical protein